MISAIIELVLTAVISQFVVWVAGKAFHFQTNGYMVVLVMIGFLMFNALIEAIRSVSINTRYKNYERESDNSQGTE